ncbi:hypothetical protein ACFO4N_13920 [Camelliibacillus cellulosilyticus]|uniref:Phr family secreted Rap phosphatase inhibitor n=1 Tax=Camelliibacillus cellulosilyticus TaxID=2174486 RepID=A0ABV9GT38_9BACL
MKKHLIKGTLVAVTVAFGIGCFGLFSAQHNVSYNADKPYIIPNSIHHDIM